MRVFSFQGVAADFDIVEQLMFCAKALHDVEQLGYVGSIRDPHEARRTATHFTSRDLTRVLGDGRSHTADPWYQNSQVAVILPRLRWFEGLVLPLSKPLSFFLKVYRSLRYGILKSQNDSFS